MPRALVDTNVWVSGVLNPTGPPARVFLAFRAGLFLPVVSSPLLNEIHEVLHRPRIRPRWRMTPADVDELLALVEDRSVMAFPTGEVHLCRDPDDDLIIESALLGKARYLVSRDDDLKRDWDLIGHLEQRGVEIISVARFLGRLSAL